MMTILAWYSVVMLALMVTSTVANENHSGSVRVGSVLITLPILIFAILFVI